MNTGLFRAPLPLPLLRIEEHMKTTRESTGKDPNVIKHDPVEPTRSHLCGEPICSEHCPRAREKKKQKRENGKSAFLRARMVADELSSETERLNICGIVSKRNAEKSAEKKKPLLDAC